MIHVIQVVTIPSNLADQPGQPGRSLTSRLNYWKEPIQMFVLTPKNWDQIGQKSIVDPKNTKKTKMIIEKKQKMVTQNLLTPKLIHRSESRWHVPLPILVAKTKGPW